MVAGLSGLVGHYMKTLSIDHPSLWLDYHLVCEYLRSFVFCMFAHCSHVHQISAVVVKPFFSIWCVRSSPSRVTHDRNTIHSSQMCKMWDVPGFLFARVLKYGWSWPRQSSTCNWRCKQCFGMYQSKACFDVSLINLSTENLLSIYTF